MNIVPPPPPPPVNNVPPPDISIERAHAPKGGDAAPLDAVMSHVLRDHCVELGLGLVTDSEQLLHRFVDLDLTFFSEI